MSDIKIIYICLQILLLLTFLFSGELMSKTKSTKKYYLLALVPILSFSLISGLRFGRDGDYNVYYLAYIGKGFYEEMEFFFRIIVSIFRFFDAPYSVFVFFCSFFLITSFVFVLSNFRWACFFVLPMFLGIMGLDNLIRWYLAFSFLLIGFNLFYSRKYTVSIFFIIIAIGVHSGTILIVFFLAGFYYFFNKKLINPYIAIGCLFVTMFLGSTRLLIEATSLLNIFTFTGGSERMMHYLSNAQDIAAGEMKSGIYIRTFSNNVRLFVCYSIPIFLGILYVKKINPYNSKNIVWFTNLCVCSIIIMPIFNLVEIFNRIAASLSFFSIIYIGHVLWYVIRLKSNSLKIKCLCAISFILMLYPIFKTPFDREDDDTMLFIWDANGREYLHQSIPDYYF